MDFAERIRKEKEGEVKFNFLNQSNPYHAFFLHKVEEFRSGTAGVYVCKLENARHDKRNKREEKMDIVFSALQLTLVLLVAPSGTALEERKPNIEEAMETVCK